jgi:hypothetical protein
MDLRLEAMSDELARAGDLFVALFRNGNNGMSYIRFVTKDQIEKIETKKGDWETELVYHESGGSWLGCKAMVFTRTRSKQNNKGNYAALFG